MFFRNVASKSSSKVSDADTGSGKNARTGSHPANFRQLFATRMQEEIYIGSVIAFIFSIFVFAVYVKTLYPSGKSVAKKNRVSMLMILTTRSQFLEETAAN